MNRVLVRLCLVAGVSGCAAHGTVVAVNDAPYTPAPVPVRGAEYEVSLTPFGELVKILGPMIAESLARSSATPAR